ncbi:hypothetical protein FA15DRAFT_636915 [Coprinopsis marcescibilis]|uniref:Integrase core domain-containing protein n=1 Tax=Coprinopsis marcescibilis TaxID=230819 RepID=A0A5C3L230_COPMA|nr:hypothetical protein FA15DRAFT_636915 [Coprinopsis marcescibilis]
MVNASGSNQWGDKTYPPNDDLRTCLLECVKLKYTWKQKLECLQREFGLKIGLTKLREIEGHLKIPSVRKPQLSSAEIEQAAIDIIRKDLTQGNGPNAIKSMLQDKEILIPRDTIRDLMCRLAPEGFEKRAPGAKTNQVARTGLISLGPYCEVSADGHEKMNGQAIRMGDVSFGIYAYRDKFSSVILKLTVLPDCRNAAPLAHLYLDLIHEIGGIPIKLTTDKGPERGWQQALQDALRRTFGPDIDVEVFATAVAIKSIHNTVIESLWRWLQSSVGKNLREIVELGRDMHIFQAHQPFHTDLFYWIFVPIVQKALDDFRIYWNHHLVRYQSTKQMPSSHVPADALKNPQSYDPNAVNCLIPIPQDAQDSCRQMIEAELGPRADYFSWYSTEFDEVARAAHANIGSTPIELENAWDVFNRMAEELKDVLE